MGKDVSDVSWSSLRTEDQGAADKLVILITLARAALEANNYTYQIGVSSEFQCCKKCPGSSVATSCIMVCTGF